MASYLSVKSKSLDDLHVDKLPRVTRKAFLYCVEHLSFLADSKWYLAGGTALALQVGHRQSVDLDFFTPQSDFQENDLERKLAATKEWTTSFRQEGTIYGILAGAKVSFIAYPFFKPSSEKIRCGKVTLLSSSDIAAMK